MAALSRLSGGRILVIGRAGLDIYPDPPGTRTEEAARFTACLGGSSANIAVALVRLGCRAALLTRVSDDAVGRFCLNELDRYGVDRSLVRSEGGEARTSLAVVESRVEDHQSVIYRNGAADFAMTGADVAAADLSAFDAMILTGTALAAEPSRGASFAALDRARDAGLPVILDLDYRPYSWPSATEAAQVYRAAAGRSDIVVGNDEEFAAMAGDATAGAALPAILIAEGAGIVVYKRGAAGARTLTAAGEIETGIFPVTALKPTGAGDAFMGGFVAGLAEGLDVAGALRMGSGAAAMVVERVGCAPAMPTRAELDAFLAGRGPL
jgi:5-dehydro-2-deoxygluconokinase